MSTTVTEEVSGDTHVLRHRAQSRTKKWEERHLLVQEASIRHQSILKSLCPTGNSSKDLYTEVYPGTHSVTVGSSALTKKTHAVAAD